jgi:hypothetical protein
MARAAFGVLPDRLQGQILHRTGRFTPWANGHPPQAEPCPAGMSIGPPDFVGIGVPKAGTSWWFSLIQAHPDVASPPVKELNYFNRWFFRQLGADGEVSDDQLRGYHAFFPRPPGSIIGEWTPSYLFAHRLPPILERAAPQANMLVLLRDPIERYQSDISRRMPSRRLRNVRYKGVARGIYTPELAPWETTYPRHQMLVLQYEACTRDPVAQLAATYRFLGLDDSYRPRQLDARVNETRSKRSVSPGFRDLLVEIYEPDVVTLARRYPEIDLELWPNFSHLARERPLPVD